MVNVNVNNTDLRVLLNGRRMNVVGDKFVRPRGVIKNFWRLSKMIFGVKDRKLESFQRTNDHHSKMNAFDRTVNAMYDGRSMAKRLVNQYPGESSST